MKWNERPIQPLRGEIITCGCGNKYLKTRDQQKTCIQCLIKARILAAQ